MALVSLATVKAHLRVYHADDDVLIGAYQAAAESVIVHNIDRVVLPIGATLPDDDDTAMIVDPAISAAILLLTGHLFEHRETVSDVQTYELPMGVKYLIAPFRVWRKFEEDEDPTVYAVDPGY